MVRKALGNLGKITFKSTNVPVPDPCIKVRKGSGKYLAKNLFFNPLGTYQVVDQVFISKQKPSELKRLLKEKRKETICLYARR